METKIQYSIILDGMEFYACHGCCDIEKKVKSHFVVNLKIDTASEDVFINDDIRFTINYVEAYEQVKTVMEISHSTLESLAWDIIQKLRKHFPPIIQVHCEVRKISPPLGGKVGYTSVILDN